MEPPAQETPPPGPTDGPPDGGGRKRAAGSAGGSRRGPGNRKEDWIASQLRRVYDGAAEEQIPKSMLDLLQALDDTEGGGRG